MSSRRRTLGTGSPDYLRNLRPEAAEYRRAVLVAREALATARTPDAHRAAVSALEAAEVGFALQLRAAERRRHARVAERGLEPSFGRAPPTRGGAEDEGEGGWRHAGVARWRGLRAAAKGRRSTGGDRCCRPSSRWERGGHVSRHKFVFSRAPPNGVYP